MKEESAESKYLHKIGKEITTTKNSILNRMLYGFPAPKPFPTKVLISKMEIVKARKDTGSSS